MNSMASKQLRIGIVGGGIGGLTLALSLRRRGLGADVYEQASELREIGAAVALSANSTRELDRLGAAVSTEPTELIWRGWNDDRKIVAFPNEGAYRERFGAPYFGIHRADLQRVLGGMHGPDRLHLGHRLAGISEHDDVIRLSFANGHTAEVDILIGADGVRSEVRRYVLFRHECLSWHCSYPRPAVASRPASFAILDGAERASLALCNRSLWRGRQLLCCRRRP
jgi:salicylate hydroxylase